MNPKDYKEIGGIIKKNTGYGKEGVNLKLFKTSNELADYFEREDKEKIRDGVTIDLFNRKQFLKDCGVK